MVMQPIAQQSPCGRYETLQQALLESIQTHAETGTQRHIAITAIYLLKLLQNQTPPKPAITELI
jgi:hypothetical protein